MLKAAIYTRYSTDNQREASIEDQVRVCMRLADRHGYAVIRTFSDPAISGGTAQRPGYQGMLTAARAGEIDAIFAEDASRLWRNIAEQAPRLAELQDLGVVVITHDLDTRQDTADVLSAVTGVMNARYRKEIGRRSRRGIEGRALAKESTGGRTYGYVPACDSPTRRRTIDPKQAEVVRQIFGMYRDGYSPREIADKLNAEGVPSPGSSWKRSKRRRKGWVGSAIYGHPKRGLGILNNVMYTGRIIWGRATCTGSAVDSKHRRRVENPRSTWHEYHDESLRIVDDALWQAVKAKQTQSRNGAGVAIRAGIERRGGNGPGRGPKFLFSGLLVCGTCGSPYTIASATSYACSGFINGGRSTCTNNARFRRDRAEAVLLEGIRRDMGTPAVADEFCRRVRERLRELAQPAQVDIERMAKLEAQIANLLDVMANHGLAGSTSLAERLRQAEAELTGLKAEQAASDITVVEKLLPGLAATYTRQLDRLAELLTSDAPKAREILRIHVGPLTVEVGETEFRFLRETGHAEAALLRVATGGRSASNVGSGGRI